MKTKPKPFIAEQFELPIAPVVQSWAVKVRFASGSDALEFKDRLEKTIAKGNSQLYTALLFSALQKTAGIVIEKES